MTEILYSDDAASRSTHNHQLVSVNENLFAKDCEGRKRVGDREALNMRTVVWTRDVKPEEESRTIYRQAIASLDNDSLSTLERNKGITHLTVALCEECCHTSLPLVLAMFMKKHPGYSLHIFSEHHDLLHDAVISQPPLVAHVILYDGRYPNIAPVLWSEQLVWLGQRGLLSDDYGRDAPIPLVLPSVQNPVRSAILAALRESGHAWAVRFESSSTTSILSALRAGIGSGAGTALSGITDGVAEVPLNCGLPPLPEAKIVMVITRHSSSPPSVAFASFLRLAATLCFERSTTQRGPR